MKAKPPSVSSSRPYLLRAIHEWLVDNGLTPQIVVRVDADDVQVPMGFVEDGQIVLNIAPSAVRGLQLGNEWVEFSARFSGAPFQVAVPVRSIQAISARENGAGMAFAPDDPATPDPDPPAPPTDKGGRPPLWVVK